MRSKSGAGSHRLLPPIRARCNINEGIVKKYLGEKLVGHISRDSTAIDAREKAVKKEKQQKELCR
jgi:hypothetical protein